MKIGVGDTNRNVVNNKIGIGGAWRTVKEIKMGVAGAWRSVWKRAVELIRTFTTKSDLDTCTLTDVVATDVGDVELKANKLISSLPVGAKVRSPNTKYNNAVIGFVVGHQAAGRTKLITEKIISIKTFDASEPSNTNTDRKNYGNNRYSYSNIGQWLNKDTTPWYAAKHTYDAPPNSTNVFSGYNEYEDESGFLTNFESAFKNALLNTTLTVAKNIALDGGGSETVTQKVYLLSNTEVGLAAGSGIAEGIKWDLFSDDTSRLAYPTVEAVTASEYTNSNLSSDKAWGWWLRTPRVVSNHVECKVDSNGATSTNGSYAGTEGLRPALELSNSVVVSDTPDEDGYYTFDFSAGAYAQCGTVESPAIDLSSAIAAETSEIEFATTTPTGTTATVQTALSTDGGTNWGNWQTATSGAAIPGLTAGADVSNTRMKWKATLSTNDTAVTPKLHEVAVKLNEGM